MEDGTLSKPNLQDGFAMTRPQTQTDANLDFEQTDVPESQIAIP